jgi:ubiquinone/menaquinone biosynthesis C-methylase UbiE
MKTNYDIASVTYDNTRNASSAVIDMLSGRFDFGEKSKVLDFGCGTGNYLFQLRDAFKCELFGLEPSEGMRQIAADKNKTIKFAAGNHENIPFEDNFFDLIYMTDVIHHVPDLNNLFYNLFKKVNKNGLVCIITESYKQIESRWYNKYFKSLIINEKKRYPDIPVITESAERQGFKIYCIDLINHGNEHIVTNEFIRMVEEKNYSMFRQLDNEEYRNGLIELKKDINKTIVSESHGESLIWFKK